MSNKNRKYKLLIIIIAALITIFLLMGVVRIPGMINNKYKENIVKENNGYYNLTEMENVDEIFTLLPSDIYYPNILLNQNNIKNAIGINIKNHKELHANYMSQRFLVKVPKDNTVYSLKFLASGRHAMRVYVNGVLVGQSGKVGITKEDTIVWENNLTCYATPKDGVMDIYIQLSQFYHYRYGARFATLDIQNSLYNNNNGINKHNKGFFMIGIFICEAILLLCIYLFQSRTKMTLYFVLACLVIGFRECIQSQAWTAFSFINGNTSFMLEYMSVVLLTIFLTLYLGEYLEKRHFKIIKNIAIIGSICYGICLIVGDSIFYTSILKYYQIFLLICIIPGISGLIWEMPLLNKEQIIAAYGILVFYMAAISDIMLYNNIFGYQHPKTPISEIAMLIFALAQTSSLIFMNNRILAESKTAEQNLEVEKKALEKLNQMKTEVLGNVSHELKTPLTVISGYAQITKQLAENKENLDRGVISKKMKLISSEAERLSLMVGQVLDLTRMEEGYMNIEIIPCYIDEIIHEAIQTHYPILNKNSNRLEIHIEGNIPKINADPKRISQIIINLISNAARFTEGGLITVSAKKENDNIVVCVNDTGVGISEIQSKSLFERYSFKERTGGSQNTGTGLGLYICKSIVEQHNGTIWIKSKEGQGTSVFFTIPIA